MVQNLMIADDSIPMHKLIKSQLASDCFTFHSAYDGASAVAMAGAVRPDLILLDIDMPNMNGIEACRAIKADPATASIPVVFLSADSVSADKQKAIEFGALDYIKKPFRPDQLREAVHTWLDAVPVSEDPARIDPLTGLLNKDCFEQHLLEQYKAAKLSGRPLACLVYELDQIGSIHTRYGTVQANQVIRKLAQILIDPASHGSGAFAFASGRFAALLLDHDRSQAAKKAARIQALLARPLRLDSGVEVAISCSVGVSDSNISSAMDLYYRAVALVNRAMDRGGNCIAVARDHLIRFSPPASN